MSFIFNSLLLLQSTMDLSQYRKEFFPVSVFENELKEKKKVYVVNKDLKAEELHDVNSEKVKDSMERWKDRVNKVDFYRLQFYNGKDRMKATSLLRSLSNNFPSITFDLIYKHSNFIVLSQKYFSLIEALVIYKSIGYINVIIIHNEE